MRSYRPEELFDETGRLRAGICRARAQGDARMGANPHANGGLLLQGSDLPDFCDYAVDVPKPGVVIAEATRVMGEFLRDVMKLNADGELPRRVARTRPLPTAGTRSSR